MQCNRKLVLVYWETAKRNKSPAVGNGRGPTDAAWASVGFDFEVSILLTTLGTLYLVSASPATAKICQLFIYVYDN
jgi:hypothetical protein